MSSFSKIDIFLGTFDENAITKKHLTASRVYHQSSLTWCVQKRKQVSLYKLFFYIWEDSTVCIAIGFVTILLVFGGYAGQMFERCQKWDSIKILVHCFFLFLGFSTVYNPQNNAHRIGFAFMLMGCVIHLVLINCVVIRLLTEPLYHSQIQTVSEILEQNFDLVSSEFALQKLKLQDEVNITY